MVNSINNQFFIFFLPFVSVYIFIQFIIIHFNNEILPKLNVPKDYFKDRGFTNFGPVESLYDVHNYLWHYNKYLRDLAKKSSNVQVIPYSPFSFGFEKGGAIELELTPKQIKEYIKKGYIVEDI